MLKLNTASNNGRSGPKVLKTLALALACVGTLSLGASAFASQLVDSINYSFRATLVDTGVDTDARGTVSGNLSRKGLTDKQSLKISVSKLDVTTGYHFVAFLDGTTSETNATDFATDRHGSFSTNYVKSANPRAHQLPTVMDPLTNVREFDIVNGSGATVSVAMITNAASFSYSVKRAMDITGFLPSAGGVLTLSGGPRSTRVSVKATGLTPSTSYKLLVNGVAVTTKTSDRRGRLSITGPRTGLPLVLNITTVALADDSAVNVILISTGLGIPGVITTASQGPVVLGTAATYAVLAGSTVTSTGNSDVTGDLGVWPGSAVTGFAGIVPGGAGTVHGTIHAGDAAAQIAQGDLTTAYNDAKGRTLAPIDEANADLGGKTLAPGLYKSTGTLSLTGTVTLDGQGNPNSVFIFQVASALNTASGSQVVLIGNAKAANVFWQVGSAATLGSTTSFKGTIMANQAISMDNSVILEGRALARIAAVTMDTAAISVPTP